MSTVVGVLALQGDFAAHVRALRATGAAIEIVEVRRVDQLNEIDALVLPGGESTALLKLMAYEPWFERLRAFHAAGGAMLATCAGVILLAKAVRSPSQPSLGLIDIDVERNGYGRQIDSFETDLELTLDEPRTLRAVFIRAPRIERCGPDVERLAEIDGEAVLVRQGKVVACTFHPELTEEPLLHRWFLAEMLGVSGADAPALLRIV